MKTSFYASILVINHAVTAFAASTPNGDLERVLFTSIKLSETINEAEQNSSRLLNQFAKAPSAIGRIHASMAFRYRNANPLDPDKVTQRCQTALKFPLTTDLTCRLCELEGDMFQLKAKDAKLFDNTVIRQQALKAYLVGLQAALKTSSKLSDETGEHDTFDAKAPAVWAARIKGIIENLYINVPYLDEIASEGERIGLDAATLQELANRAKKAGDMAVSATTLKRDPTPAGIKLQAREYEVEGTLDKALMRDMFSKDKPIARTQGNFTIFVRDCAWLIRSTMSDGSQNGPQTEEIGCENGSEIVLLWMQETSDTGTAIIVSNNMPVNLTGTEIACHLWLMFASRCYFKQLTTNWLTPVYDSKASVHGDPNLALHAEWELMDGALPRKVIYYNPGGYYDLVGLNQVKFTPYHAPFNGGFTNAMYLMTGITNFHGIPFPTGFLFEEYKPGGPGRYGLWACQRVEVTVTAFRTACSRKSLLPPPAGRISVIDYRLNHNRQPVQGLTYMNPTGRWASPEEAEALSKK